MIKIQILKTHPRAEDCRNIRHFTKGEVVELSDDFAARILKDKMAIRIEEEKEVDAQKAIITAPENKMIAADVVVENKSIDSLESNQPAPMLEPAPEVKPAATDEEKKKEQGEEEEKKVDEITSPEEVEKSEKKDASNTPKFNNFKKRK